MTAVGSDKLQVSVRHERPGLAVVSFSGDLDAVTVRTCRDEIYALIEKGATTLVADLTDLALIDSAGIALLVSLLKRARLANGSVRLVQPSRSAVRQLLQLTRLDLVFESADSVEAALQNLSR